MFKYEKTVHFIATFPGSVDIKWGGEMVGDPGGQHGRGPWGGGGKMVGEAAIYSCFRSRKAGIAKSPKRQCLKTEIAITRLSRHRKL